MVKLSAASKEVAKGNYSIRVEDSSRMEEVQTTFRNFNAMIKQLDSISTLSNDFAANVSHEFKTPLTAVEGYAMLLQDPTLTEKERQEYIEQILSNVHRLTELVGNILLLSKIENKGLADAYSQFPLDEQIRQAVLQLEPEWEKKEIEFDIELERIEYTGNEVLLMHVWNNLIGNAIKFDPQGGMVRIRLWKNDERILCTVEDNGPGIKPGDEAHIFDRFFQSDSSHKEEGNGLGLALVKQIVKAEGGQVTVANMEKGCRFTIQL